MVPLYGARIEDLGPGDFVKVECIACGHAELIPPSSLLHGLRLPPYTHGVRFGTTAALPGVRCAWQGGRVDQVGRELAGGASDDATEG